MVTMSSLPAILLTAVLGVVAGWLFWRANRHKNF
jgi:hypothetical protein